VRAQQQGDLGATPQDVADDTFMRLSSVFTQRLEPENVAQAFNNGGLTGSPTTDQHVEILVQVNGHSVQEAPLPGQCEKFGVVFRRSIAGQANSGLRIEKGLAQTFRGNL